MDDELKKQHTREAINNRLSISKEKNYLGDSILGAIDGTVTTFAIVSGVAGAGLKSEIAIILGLANLLGDGFSMAASNFLKAKSDKEVVDLVRKAEEHHIENIPEGEREEIRQVFEKKGFEGKVLDEIVDVITQNKEQWVNTMITEEHGLSLEVSNPYKAGLVTFISFCIVGFIPLMPFLVVKNPFIISSIITAGCFFAVGFLKGIILDTGKFKSGIETLFIGIGAAFLAYIIGVLTKGIAS